MKLRSPTKTTPKKNLQTKASNTDAEEEQEKSSMKDSEKKKEKKEEKEESSSAKRTDVGKREDIPPVEKHNVSAAKDTGRERKGSPSKKKEKDTFEKEKKEDKVKASPKTPKKSSSTKESHLGEKNTEKRKEKHEPSATASYGTRSRTKALQQETGEDTTTTQGHTTKKDSLPLHSYVRLGPGVFGGVEALLGKVGAASALSRRYTPGGNKARNSSK